MDVPCPDYPIGEKEKHLLSHLKESLREEVAPKLGLEGVDKGYKASSNKKSSKG